MGVVGPLLRTSDELFGPLWRRMASELILRHFFKKANFGVKPTDIQCYQKQFPFLSLEDIHKIAIYAYDRRCGRGLCIPNSI